MLSVEDVYFHLEEDVEDVIFTFTSTKNKLTGGVFHMTDDDNALMIIAQNRNTNEEKYLSDRLIYHSFLANVAKVTFNQH